MPERTLPGLGLTGFWDLGQDGWKDGMDANLRLLSALVGQGVVSRTASLPTSGGAGDVYIVPASAPSNANQIAMWDGPDGAQAWVYAVPQSGWRLRVRSEGVDVVFDGSAWVTGGASGDYVESNTTGITGSDRIVNAVSLTTAEHTALATKDPATLYVITDAV